MRMRHHALLISGLLSLQFFSSSGLAAGDAWNPGHPAAGLNSPARELIADFKTRATALKTATTPSTSGGNKLRILIIGDSLSDGYYHWSHTFRAALQEAYGDGGIGTVNADTARAPADKIAGWLFERGRDLNVALKQPWRGGFASRDDTWPWLGWNGHFIATDSPAASVSWSVRAATITTVYTTGSYEAWEGRPVSHRAGGFTLTTDGKPQTIAPSAPGSPLDVTLTRAELPQGLHTVTLDGVHDGWLWLHGLLLENATPGVVVYNIANGGWWPHNFLQRQPGFDKTLHAMKPDYILYFLSKPDSEANDHTLADEATEPDYRRLMARVAAATGVPDTRTLHINTWGPRSGQSSARDTRARARRMAWLSEKNLPVLDLNTGLDTAKMRDLGWYKDNIHLARPGGEGIGKAIVALFLP